MVGCPCLAQVFWRSGRRLLVPIVGIGAIKFPWAMFAPAQPNCTERIEIEPITSSLKNDTSSSGRCKASTYSKGR